MIKIGREVRRELTRFWNHALFHPTDAVEDPWGRRILDRMAEDKAVSTVRIYAMLEDVVYIDGEGNLAYDFRLNDLRLDYLVSLGFELLIAYAGMPDCIAKNTNNKTSVSKNKTRYKGKLFNTSPPRTPELWEEVCYQYTKHIVERYGIDRVSCWQLQCFNEPDIAYFFMSELPENAESVPARLAEYCKMYEAFQRGVRRVTERISIGGPALARFHEFLGGFLDFVRERELKLDFISVHNYGTSVLELNSGRKPLSVMNNVRKHEAYVSTVEKHGFGDIPLVVDEWGASAQGFYNIEECPALLFRETEVFSSYFTKMIYEFIEREFRMSKLIICLSGQHEMTEDFSGFRNFFTLNFIAKPIYNANILSGFLRNKLVSYEHSCENLYVIPSTDGEGSYGVMLTYSEELFGEELPEIDEELSFEESIEGKRVEIYCIDKSNNNPYRTAERLGIGSHPTDDEIRLLREEGRLKPQSVFTAGKDCRIPLKLTANCTYFVKIEG